MKIYDISQEVFGCAVYPGDPAPEKRVLNDMGQGALYQLTAFSMCAHNGTHVDAPAHFLKEGKTVDQMSLEQFVGSAYVAAGCGTLGEQEATAILEKARSMAPESANRILIKGPAVVSEEAAKVFAEAGTLLVGNESQSVGPEKAPMAVHLILLNAGCALLEGVRLEAVPEGVYFLSAAPLLLGSTEGAPCRAVLIEGIWG